MKALSCLFLAGIAATPAALAAQTAPAPAQAAAAPAVGETVYDSTGAVMGTVEAVSPQAVVINTGAVTVPVPPTSVGKDAKGWHMAMTKADLEAAGKQAQAQQQAQLKTALTPGAQVRASDGTTVIGTVKAADDQFVTLTSQAGGREVKLPIAGFGLGPSGVVVGMTAEQFNAAVGGAAPAGAPGAAPAPAPSN
ncbi:hypothetical protein [Sphingomonas sp. DT-204]|uniref:hypothetical protein n=1 Tax=Sphingomonas sp. DT-204 TaxID=3396166 RepID=UPI003F19E1B9